MKKPRWRWGVPHVDYQEDRHGIQRWSYRRGKGPRTPLPPWGTAEFRPAWEAAHQAAEAGAKMLGISTLGAKKTRPGSLSAALVAYYTAPAWTHDLADGSRSMRRKSSAPNTAMRRSRNCSASTSRR